MRPAVGLLLFYKEKSEENENMKNYKIAVAGTGYVGLSLSVLLAQHNQVTAVDIVQAKVDMINHFGLEKDSYILFLGRLVPEKESRYLVEVFKNVKTDKKLVIAGGSSDTDSFMEGSSRL